MTTLTINSKKLSSDKKDLELVVNDILNDYTDFDIHLMKKYIETKDLDDSNFTNI